MLQFVFVHGLSGWGSYDPVYKRMPYWGMRGGDLIPYLTENGFFSYAASVSPSGSAWDRACELYAQLVGTRVDYGVSHSREYRHERFGKDFTGRALIPSLDEDTRLVLLGHSFGGATVRLFSELFCNGDRREQEETDPDDLSPFFAGTARGSIHSIVTLASPMNGTTAYDMFEDAVYDIDAVRIPLYSRVLAGMMSKGTAPKRDGRDARDYADYDMHLDAAAAMNQRIHTFPDVYYFSVPCSCTVKTADGTWTPETEKMEALFAARSMQMGKYEGQTKGGIRISRAWQENDGLVNTISAAAPFGAPQVKFDKEHIHPGMWNVYPVYHGDHMSLQGGLMKKNEIRSFYMNMLTMIRDLDSIP